MRVALLHNRYRERGGEDRAVAFEADLLRKAGCEVHEVVVDNREALAGSSLRALGVAVRTRWNRESAARVRELLARHPVDVGHVHNFFPLLSPSVHAALREGGVAVVQTLHNYRLLCANAALLRDGRPCEECVARGPWNALRYGCYRGSRAATAVWSEMTAHHRRRDTWRRCVDLFAVPSEFARRKLAAGGLPAERLRVVPGAVADPGEPRPCGRGAVYVGRLSPEKGLRELLEAWRALDGYPLAIVGGGPEEPALRALAAGVSGVRFLGPLPAERVAEALRRACFLVAPSRAYETFGMAVAEAMAHGRAAVVPAHGALAERVEAGRSGLVYDAGDPRGLVEACRALAHDPQRAAAMGREARVLYKETLAPDRATARLTALYAEARRCRA